MIRIQSDIVAKCTTNARSPMPTANDSDKQSVQANGTRSINGDARVTASTTARLTLQERLAAVTRGKSTSPSTSSSAHAAASKSNPSKQSTPPPKPARPTAAAKSSPVKKKAIDADTITTTTHQIELFEEMLAAEASQRDEMVDTPRSPEEVILVRVWMSGIYIKGMFTNVTYSFPASVWSMSEITSKDKLAHSSSDGPGSTW